MSSEQYKPLTLDTTLGFGTMSMTWKLDPPPLEQSVETLKYVSSHPKYGTKLFNGGEIYGVNNINLKLWKQFVESNTDEENREIIISLKGGFAPGSFSPDGSKANITRSIENIVSFFPKDVSKRPKLLYEMARADPNTPYEETVGYIADFVKSGKIDGISLSEVGVNTIRKASKVFPISCVEVEFSLYCQDILHNGVLEELSKQRIPVIAYSPLGRGLFTDYASDNLDKFVDSMAEFDTRKTDKVSPKNFEHNKKLILKFAAYAHDVKKTSLESLAISWILAISEKKEYKGIKNVAKIIPIPSGSTKERVDKTFGNVIELTDADLEAIDKIHEEYAPRGFRYDGKLDELNFF